LTPKELNRLITIVPNPRQKKDYKDGRSSRVVTNMLDTKL
ncbi:hypothetical protein BAE44_0018195, partial [Dichanthelium oligosanthes]